MLSKEIAGGDRRSSGRRYALLFLLLYFPCVYFNHGSGWNQGARFAELHAIVLQGSLAIDSYHEMTGDKAHLHGQYYCEKAPAITLLALPAFGVAMLVQLIVGAEPLSDGGRRISQWITTAGSVTLLAALGGVAFFALLRHQLGDRAAYLGTFAVVLGSLTLPYAGSLFAHAGTIGLLLITLWSILGRQRRDSLGGLCAGLAIASEYPALFPVVGLLVYLMTGGWDRGRRFAIALLPGIVLILLKNYAITGSFLIPVYGFNPTFAQISARHAFGFGWPTWERIGNLIWSEQRGLLFWNPAFLLAPVGLVTIARRDLALAVTLSAATALIVIQTASFSGWDGGDAFGPRYLSPAIPLIGLASAYGIARCPRIGWMLVALSISLMAIVAAVGVQPPGDIESPLRDFYLVHLRQLRLDSNLGALLGLSPLASVLLLAALSTLLVVLLLRAGRSPAREIQPRQCP